MSGFVYAIEIGDLIKIGWSRQAYCRGSRLLGMVEATREQAAELQGLLAPWRVRRGWFRPEGAIRHFLSLLPPTKPAHPLRQYRRANGWSQDELAGRLGVTKMTLSRWECGTRMPRPREWPRIALITGVTPLQLAQYRAEADAVGAGDG